jgi:hypothetical protein
MEPSENWPACRAGGPGECGLRARGAGNIVKIPSFEKSNFDNSAVGQPAYHPGMSDERKPAWLWIIALLPADAFDKLTSGK